MSKTKKLYMDRMEDIYDKFVRGVPLTDEEKEFYFSGEDYDDYLFRIPPSVTLNDYSPEYLEAWIAREEDKYLSREDK